MDIFSQLKRDEGVRLFPYADSAGKLTIGIGRNLTDDGISAEEANQMLQNDVASALEGLHEHLPWFTNLDDARQGVLLNMAFNLGVTGLLAFHNALTYMEKGDWENAARELLASRWAGQVGERASRLADQLRTGQWI